MPIYTFYKVTHPEEEGCYVGYTTSKWFRTGWMNAKSGALKCDSTRLAEVCRKHNDGFVLESLGQLEVPASYIKTYIIEVAKMHNASWRTSDVGSCPFCNYHFSTKLAMETHVNQRSCQRHQHPTAQQILGF